jgi:hypothetical protein
MVTSQVEVAAFVLQPQVPFVLMDNLEDVLRADESPIPGWCFPYVDDLGEPPSSADPVER